MVGRRSLAAGAGLLLAALVAALALGGYPGQEGKAELEASGGSLDAILAAAKREVSSDRKLTHGVESRSQRVKKEVAAEAKQEEMVDCEPFCGGAGGHAELAHSLVQALSLRGVSRAPKLDGSAHSKEQREAKREERALTSEDKKKIHEAALKIAGVISDSQGMSSDVKREMSHIQKLGTGWGALWGSSGSSGSGRGMANFEYLASGPSGRAHGSDPLGGDFHY